MYPDRPSCYFREPAFSLVYKVALSDKVAGDFMRVGEETRKLRSGANKISGLELANPRELYCQAS